MPRRVKPRYGWLGVEEIKPISIDAGDRASIAAFLGSERAHALERILTLIAEVGGRYRAWKEQDEGGPTRAEVAAALRQVARASRDLLAMLSGIDSKSEWELLVDYVLSNPEGGSKDESAIERLQSDRIAVERLVQASANALKRSRRRRGRTPRSSLPWLVGQLCNCYEHLTARPVTHSAATKGEYAGQPKSVAGQFVWRAVRAIDKSITPEMVATEISRFVKGRKSSAGK